MYTLTVEMIFKAEVFDLLSIALKGGNPKKLEKLSSYNCLREPLGIFTPAERKVALLISKMKNVLSLTIKEKGLEGDTSGQEEDPTVQEIDFKIELIYDYFQYIVKIRNDMVDVQERDISWECDGRVFVDIPSCNNTIPEQRVLH